MNLANGFVIRDAQMDDIDQLVDIENACFTADKMSKRSFKHQILSPHNDLQVIIDNNQKCVAYGLVFNHKGTRLARLYSLAVSPAARGHGLAKALLTELENKAAYNEKHYMRLEVAKSNQPAIELYLSFNYRVFGEYQDYYEDHTDALRMQKRIRHVREKGIQRKVPWQQQRTEFTCGPAALLMAMSSLRRIDCSIENELDIWREATTIFMTSGHGGCHPFGLALAAKRRKYKAEVWLNTQQPLFLDGVRSQHKKDIMSTVHHHFVQQCKERAIPVHYQAISLIDIENHLKKDHSVLILVSTFRFDGKKAPHWVLVTGMDNDCLFVHDPDMDNEQSPMDCQYIPIAKLDFEKMSSFGTQRMKTAVIISL